MLLTGLLLSLTCGFTNCSYFSEVTVPGHNSTRPDVFGGVYDANGHGPIAVNGSGVVYDAPSYSAGYYLYGSGMDSSGVRRVDMELKIQVACCDPGGLCLRNLDQTIQTLVQTQPGHVGQSVSDGMYAGRLITPQQIIASRCSGARGPAGPEDMIKATWRSTAEDFHGNWNAGGDVTFYYNWQGPR